MKYINALVVLVVVCSSCQLKNKTEAQSTVVKHENKKVIPSNGPTTITRNLIRDRKGHIWMASWNGMYKYDGQSFTNMTSKVSSGRFFSVTEDSKGNLWFGTIGAGVYYYDGKSFQNFTTRDGLLNNDVNSLYEDKKGNMWFGVGGGASRYDGKSFRNYIINGEVMNEDPSGQPFSERPPDGVSAIMEDKAGRFWLATTGNTFVYDRKIFTKITNKGGKPFENVRSIIEDKKGNIWLGGSDGLWHYDGSIFTDLTRNPVANVYEDNKGNIWTSSLNANELGRVTSGYNTRTGVLSRYDEASLSGKKPSVIKITDKPVIFGIVEDDEGNIWFGASDGVYRYDGNAITSFNGKEAQK